MPALYALAARWLPYIVGALVVYGVYCTIRSDAATEALRVEQVQAQEAALATKDATIAQLLAEASINARLVLQAQSAADAQAALLAKTTNTLREIMKDEPCRNVQLPAAAVERLRLRATGKD